MNAQEAERLAARLVCIGFDGLSVTDDARALLARGVASVILFARNAGTPDVVRELVDSIRGAAEHPTLVCVDQEGGPVQRFTDGFTIVPPMREIGATGDAERAREVGRLLARELRAVGVDLDLAPVVDVDSNPANPIIGERSFAADPRMVSAMATAFIDGLQGGGVAACGKHFPGHGDTELDSHHDLPMLTHDLERLARIELPPFEAAVAADVACLMTAHVVFPALDPDHPATLSPAAIDGLIRGRLGFDGVVMTDDLEMKAIADRMPLGQAAVAAVGAGADLLMCCHTPAEQHGVIDAVAQAIVDGTLDEDRVHSAHRRLDRLTATYVA